MQVFPEESNEFIVCDVIIVAAVFKRALALVVDCKKQFDEKLDLFHPLHVIDVVVDTAEEVARVGRRVLHVALNLADRLL